MNATRNVINDKKGARRRAGFLLLLALTCLLWQGAAAQIYQDTAPEGWEEKERLRITFFAVGEGDAMLLECGGERMMIDGGPRPFRDPLQQAMKERGIDGFKYLLNTHSHDDHISGLYYLMEFGFTAGEYLHPYTDWWAEADPKLHGKTVRMAEKMNIPLRKVGEGDVLSLGEATLYLHRYTEISNTNAKSLVTRVVFGDASALLCADITGKAQKGYLTFLPPEELKADVIKIPHHGITPVEPEFLNAVSPAFAVITNYNDPKRLSKTTTQLEGRGIPYVFSGEGTVTMETDGTDWLVRQTEGAF